MRHKLPLVLVEWDDAWTDHEPITEYAAGIAHGPERLRTLGWVLKEDDVGITVVNEFYGDEYRGRTFIPRGMVRSVTRYTLQKPRTGKQVADGN
jgi:hypothetical protein